MIHLLNTHKLTINIFILHVCRESHKHLEKAVKISIRSCVAPSEKNYKNIKVAESPSE